MLKKMLMTGMLVVLLGWAFSGVGQAAPPAQQQTGREYVIQADDWLSKLAEKYLGDGNHWTQIVAATNAKAATDSRVAVINNPDLVNPGQIVFIPTETAIFSMIEPAVKQTSLAALCADRQSAVQAFCSEIPIAQVRADPHTDDGAELFTCVSRAGLANVPLTSDPVTVLVPNDGDFDLRGIVASVKLTPEGDFLIPRWPGSKFDFSPEYAEKFRLPVGEQLQLPLSTAFELIKAGELTWTGEHGLPGRAGLFQTSPPLTCDPQADFEIVIGPF